MTKAEISQLIHAGANVKMSGHGHSISELTNLIHAANGVGVAGVKLTISDLSDRTVAELLQLANAGIGADRITLDLR